MSILLVAYLAVGCVCFTEATFSTKPHIVVILADDIGWNDFSFHGSNQISTPNIDAIGYNGVFLNKLYTQAICSPSRAAFLTGKYPIRIGFQGVPLSAGEDRPLPLDTETLGKKLKKEGYKTHLVGKWHLSAARKRDLPTGRGFDTHFGYRNGFIGYFNYFASQNLKTDYGINSTLSGLDMFDEFEPQWGYQGRYATELFTEKSVQLIENHNPQEPLFLFLSHLAAHTGDQGTELGVPDPEETDRKYSYIEQPMRRKFAEIVSQLDKSVGEVFKKLAEKKMLENSVIIFLSDNGAQTHGIYQNYGSNWPLKGLKFTLLEGGVRGSAVLYSPLLSKKGYINNHLMHITDLHATLLNLALARPQFLVNKGLDGINQWPSISHDIPTVRREILLNVDLANGFSGLISHGGRYKYLNGSFNNGIYDGAFGDSGRSNNTPAYDIDAVLECEVNKAIQGLKNSPVLTQHKIMSLRTQLDISSCNGKVRTSDPPCLEECLFDLKNDPCETNNLFEEKRLVANALKLELQQYVSQTVPALNQKVDLRSDPKNCNNTWFPWLDADTENLSK